MGAREPPAGYATRACRNNGVAIRVLLTMSATLARAFRHPALHASIALVLMLALCSLVVLQGAGSAGAAKAKVLGATKQTPEASCPGDPCEAVGSVTGFQQRVTGEKGLFKVPETGHVVAWSVKLSKPDKDQRAFFGDFYRDNEFGTAPAARLAILKPKGESQFKLKKQSPAVDLGSELAATPLLTLRRPLKVRRGDIVGLTIPTWLPNFAVEQSRENSWRASRSPEKCTGEADIRDSRAHTEVGQTRRYGCTYNTARLLYWAYFVPAGGDGDGDGADGRGGDGDGGGGGRGGDGDGGGGGGRN